MEGVVIKSTGSWYDVRTQAGETVPCRLKGVFRLDESKDTNPLTVGDRVTVENEDGDWMITQIAERQNYIVRASPKHKGARQLLAANVDQCLLIVTMASPRTSTGFIDRFLLTAEAYHIPTYLVFNKQDILDPKGLKKQQYVTDMYARIGYPVHLVSTYTDQGIDELKDLLRNKTTLVAGHSGVGKSSLLNKLDPRLELRTTDISRITGKGMHTTTFAEMHFTDFGAQIIDTPGVREFGLMHFLPEEISHYYVEMRQYIPLCRFNNCMHDNEPGCAVRQAYLDGKIAEDRYINYLTIMADYKANYKHWEE
ncbi:MAG: ribosome small subunit-dependent GTPase A [Bacteroidetes bacterium]|nr:ribosome small subunit-dependent GTPase A [Bacteroidota bacterium]MBS1683560.1 ribosome small subunit-dependent GTPase A [Bacteroidota bacterium]